MTDTAACGKDGCRIVSLDWLVQSSQNGGPVAEKVYLLGPRAAENDQDGKEDTNDSAVVDGPKNGQAISVKNNAAASGDQISGTTVSKQESTATAKNGKKRGADLMTDTEDESKKKAKDAQKASSKFLSVPVDQAFIDESLHFPRESMVLSSLSGRERTNQLQSRKSTSMKLV